MTVCLATVPPDGHRCEAAAEFVISWNPLREGEKEETPVCRDCAVRLKQLAEQEHKTRLRITRLEQR